MFAATTRNDSDRRWSDVQLTIVPTEFDEPVRFAPTPKRGLRGSEGPVFELLPSLPEQELELELELDLDPEPTPAPAELPRLAPPKRRRTGWWLAGALGGGLVLGSGLVAVVSAGALVASALVLGVVVAF